jgi:putative two-component system response regulator
LTNTNEKKVILAVDDSPENLDVLKSLLTPDYTVKAAINGMMALKIAGKSPPDAILLDVRMPGMDGFEVCRKLKQEESTREIPVIFVTGEDDADMHAMAQELGAVGVMIKPVDPVSLSDMLSTCLS